VCGIGHEIDTSIADLTADVYSTTPTGAAKLIIENYIIYEERLENYKNKITQTVDKIIQRNNNYVNINKGKILLSNPQNKIMKKLNAVENCKNIINTKTVEKINSLNKEIDEYKYILGRYDYNNIFNRGFVFIKDEKNNIIDSVDSIDYSLIYSTVFKDDERKINFIKEEE
jgi:exodeoxyribonuclease VII large subunit